MVVRIENWEATTNGDRQIVDSSQSCPTFLLGDDDSIGPILSKPVIKAIQTRRDQVYLKSYAFIDIPRAMLRLAVPKSSWTL